MGGNSSIPQWQQPAEPAASTSTVPVDYHMVGSQVALYRSSDCGCCPTIHVRIDCEQLYSMLAQQYAKGYRMLYFTRMPGDMNMQIWSQVMNINFIGYFRMNPNLGEKYDMPVSWQLRVDRSCKLQTAIQDTGGFLSPLQERSFDTSGLANTIATNTQNGERLIAATVTGDADDDSYYAGASSLGPNQSIDLFFEVPSPTPRERYMYNIALVPVHVEFVCKGLIFFPEIQYDWMSTLNFHLSQGWRLVDIFIDIPMIQQLRTPQKQLRYLCRPIDTQVTWIFEKPISRVQDPTPLYEGIIVEQSVPVWSSSSGRGVQSRPDWLPVISDMGSRGWELSCFLECHSVESAGWRSATIKSLLFFQRPLV